MFNSPISNKQTYTMHIREATVNDIMQMQRVRNAVKENTLSNPDLVTDNDYKEYITEKGNGWVYEVHQQIVGFAIADRHGNNIWALFVSPAYEKQGIGKQLHDTMLNWYFRQTIETVWLSTDEQTRAALFYEKAGWKKVGKYGRDEIKFEMTYADWVINANKS